MLQCKLAIPQNYCLFVQVVASFVQFAKLGRNSVRVGGGAVRREIAAQSFRPKPKKSLHQTCRCDNVEPGETGTSMRPGTCGASASTCLPMDRGRRSSTTGRRCRPPDRSFPGSMLDTPRDLHLNTPGSCCSLRDLLCILRSLLCSKILPPDSSAKLY